MDIMITFAKLFFNRKYCISKILGSIMDLQVYQGKCLKFGLRNVHQILPSVSLSYSGCFLDQG